MVKQTLGGLLGLCLLGACGLEPTGVTFSEPAGDIGEGPGLLSGPDGVFTLYDSSAANLGAGAGPSAGTTGGTAAGVAAGTTVAAATSVPSRPTTTTERVLLPDGRVVERTITVEERIVPAGQ
ncbi:MAG: hypothetical protein AAFX00_01895 [Pseudomonadota bacterium]